MNQFDIFNGDADGICALHQLRLAQPADAILISGAKREVTLLRHAHAQMRDRVSVLDISLDSNRDSLTALLDRGGRSNISTIVFPALSPNTRC